MNGYIHPVLIRSYSIAELCEDAASCMSYVPSDRNLKRDIELVEQPLERIRSIRGD
jgi:hypothetical protein